MFTPPVTWNTPPRRKLGHRGTGVGILAQKPLDLVTAFRHRGGGPVKDIPLALVAEGDSESQPPVYVLPEDTTQLTVPLQMTEPWGDVYPSHPPPVGGFPPSKGARSGAIDRSRSTTFRLSSGLISPVQ